MDSFIKEVQRINPASLITIARYLNDDFHLSNNVVLPKGSFTAAASWGINRDPELFENPDSFDPWRFEKMRDASKDADARWQFVTTSMENLNFGHGKHGCPGRFFVAQEIKLVLGHLLENYDIKYANPEKGRPANIFQGPVVMNPDPTVNIVLRGRFSK